MSIEPYTISIACDGQLNRDDTTAKANLIEKLIALAKIGYISKPFEQVKERGSTGKTHYLMTALSESGNTHRADEVPDVCYCSPGF